MKSTRAIWFDITDLFEFYSANISVTGIQRVEIMLLLELIDRARSIGTRLSTEALRVCYFDPEAKRWREAPLESLKKRLEAFLHGKHRRSSGIAKAFISVIPKRVRPARFFDAPLLSRTSQVCDFQKDDVLVVLGAIWFRPHYLERVVDTCRAFQLRLSILVHDLIPIRFRQWFSDEWVGAMTQLWDTALRQADLLLANSQHTAADVIRFCEERGLPQHSPVVVRFGDSIPLLEGGVGRNFRRALRHYSKPGFVLSVGSIDPRKNQSLLLKVWERLYSAHGSETPYLVLLGKFVADQDSRALKNDVDDRIIHIANASDRELGELYRACTFTIFPSFAEGWGLPVAKSLACGKVCAASNATAIPEVGKDVLEYFDPNDLEACYRLVERLFYDNRFRAEAERRIQSGYKRTRWSETLEELLHAVRSNF